MKNVTLQENHSLKVLLYSGFMPPGASGSARVLGDIADHLGISGHSVDVLTNLKSDYNLGSPNAAQSYTVHRVGLLPIPGLTSIKIFLTALYIAHKERHDFLLSGVAYSGAIPIALTSLLTGIPFGVYTHGEDVTCVSGSRTKTWILKWALRRASTIMANSRHSLNAVRSLGLHHNHLEVCSPGIDASQYEMVDARKVNQLSERFGLTGKKVVLTLARLDARKGHDTIINSLRKVREAVPNVHYLVVGKGDPAGLMALAAKTGVQDCVTIVEYISREELPSLFHLCDVHAMVSRRDEKTGYLEGLGIVYLEAAASGKPSIAARAGGAPDAVNDGVTGILVDQNCSDEVANALTTLLTDAELCARMGEAGKVFVRQNFAKDQILPRLEANIVQAARALESSLPPRPAPLDSY